MILREIKLKMDKLKSGYISIDKIFNFKIDFTKDILLLEFTGKYYNKKPIFKIKDIIIQ